MDARIEQYRRSRAIRTWIVAACTGAMALLTWTSMRLTMPEEILGTLFWGGTCVAAVVTARRLSSTRHYDQKWAPRWYDGGYRGGRVTGIGVPLRVADASILPWAMALMGLALLGGAVYIGVSGSGVVGGGTGVKVVAIVLCVLFGLILALGGPLSRQAPRPDGSLLVLAAEGVHLPRPGSTGMVRWDDVATIRPHQRGGATSRAVYPDYVVDLRGADGARLAQINVTELPNPGWLVGVLEAAVHDPAMRASLASRERADQIVDRLRTDGKATPQ